MRSFALLLVACAVCFLSGTVGDDCYQPRRNIGDEAGLASDICAINDALAQSPPDYATAEEIYTSGRAATEVTLKDIATGDATEGEYADASEALLGEAGWMDALLQQAFDGEGDFDSDTKRVETIKKILISAALGHRMFTNTERSMAAAEEGTRRDAIEFLERAMANHFGLDSECAIFGNGQARGIEFGTMNEGVAQANYDLVESFGDAALAIQADPIDTESLANAYGVVQKNFLTIYLQAVIKYSARIISGSDPEKSQAEGFGYYHAIAGQVYAVNEEAHQIIFDAFDLSSEPDAEKAGLVADVVDDLLETFEIAEGSFGDFDPERNDSYVPPEELECEGVNPFVESVVDFVDSDR